MFNNSQHRGTQYIGFQCPILNKEENCKNSNRQYLKKFIIKTQKLFWRSKSLKVCYLYKYHNSVRLLVKWSIRCHLLSALSILRDIIYRYVWIYEGIFSCFLVAKIIAGPNTDLPRGIKQNILFYSVNIFSIINLATVIEWVMGEVLSRKTKLPTPR